MRSIPYNMLPYFPQKISSKAISAYLISLIGVSVVFYRYAMSFEYMLMGLAFVTGFFILSSNCSSRWMNFTHKKFVKNIFWWALSLRVVWVVFSYFFFMAKTGQPFEFEAADSMGYHAEADWLRGETWSTVWDYYFNRGYVSDSGYGLYLTTLYKVVGPNIVVTRLLKALYSSITCVLLYRLSARIMGERVGRMAGVFAVFMPNLIIYCGLHLKETEMLFLTVAFLERADATMRSKKMHVWDIIGTLLLGGSLFLFRTVLGVVALFSFVTALLFAPGRVVRKGRKFFIGLWIALAVLFLVGGTAMNEVEALLERGTDDQSLKREEQTSHGNQWAQYATGTVLAPMMFVMPFSTMVDTEQPVQFIMHGGNYVRNFMGYFVLIALFTVLFKKNNWRDFSLIGAFVIGYLGVLALSGFANAERFLLPAVPGLIAMWAYGISELDRHSYNLLKYWCLLVVLMEFGWAFFKLGSRGLFS